MLIINLGGDGKPKDIGFLECVVDKVNIKTYF